MPNAGTTTIADDGLGSLQNLQSAFNSTRRTRPPIMHITMGKEGESRIPLKLQRQTSKGGLRGMFSRNKLEKGPISPVQEEPIPISLGRFVQDVPATGTNASSSSKKLPPLPDIAPITPRKSTRSRINLKTARESKAGSRSGSKTSPKTSPKAPMRTSAAWDPPPLFQAYPQAIKHAQLFASTLSADSILRIGQNKKNTSLIREEFSQTTPGGEAHSASAKKSEKTKSKHRRQISGSISGAGWTQKIFVLVTSGYLLQYSGEGSFDRLPEKMMQLGKDSVAFASDAIPGKHWVLQVSQAMDADGTPTADSRSLLSRLTFRGADYKRTTTSILLVLDSAENMDSWLAVIRREIEALGGKKHTSETGKPKPDDKIMQLKAQPSHRYLMSRNPDQNSLPPSPQKLDFDTSASPLGRGLQRELEEVASGLINPPSFTRPLTGHESVAGSITSHDGRHLDSLTDSTFRLSYMSSGQRTIVTSHTSSPATSPTRESISTIDDFPPKLSTDDTRPRPNAHAINERRRSMQTMQIPILDAPPKSFRPHSTWGVPTRGPLPNSPPVTTNFSVPFPSPRYSSQKSAIDDLPPPLPAIIASTPVRMKSNGMRKLPPLITVPRPPSPVKVSASLVHTPPVYTPTEFAFKRVSQVKASVVDIPPRSPRSPTTSETSLPIRRSSLMPLNSYETLHIDFRFPRRHSSMQALRDPPSPDVGSECLPTAAHDVPLPPSPPLSPSVPRIERNPGSEDKNLSILSPTAKSKICRPTSMQIAPTTSLRHLSYLPPPTSLAVKTSRSPRLRPSGEGSRSAKSHVLGKTAVNRLKVEKILANRRSMPVLVNGPPPAPPPDCALPPLPPPGPKAQTKLSTAVRV
ncbi:hypothetical protein B0O99DRAFT_691646 [Bisporella sp. PMI_857]|nr:hypothetical protein B0O99DRAFT_691646 [Bisporella sp. PMI_857]